MDKDKLRQYRSMKAEIGELEEEEGKGAEELRWKLMKDCVEIEEFINAIPDSTIRRMYKLYYIQGLKLLQIGNEVGMEKSSVSKKMSAYMKLETNSTKSTL